LRRPDPTRILTTVLLGTLAFQFACHRGLVPPLPVSPSAPAVLVDASRDGGVWWYPQSRDTGFDSSSRHQGKAFADYLRASGMRVTELPRPFVIDSSLLAPFRLVIRAGPFGSYTSSELAAYQQYVSRGGRLILLSEFQRPGESDMLAHTFGLEFRGVSTGENTINRFTAHPITKGLSEIPYKIGSGIFGAPPSATILGYLSESTFIDLNGNGVQDPGEPSSAPVMGVMRFGKGQIFFMGDTNTIEDVPQPLVDNLLQFVRLPILAGRPSAKSQQRTLLQLRAPDVVGLAEELATEQTGVS
jgi:hypothetical protein